MNSNLRKSLIIFTAILISANLAVTAQDSGITRDILRAASIPILSINPDSGDQDLRFLDDFIGDAPIVVLGESRHLIREQYLLKHRITRYLVENLGFRHIAIEDSYPGTIAIDDYLKGADISPAKALEKTGAWYLWDTEEMLSLINWLRPHNDQSPTGEKVTYTGIDIEDPWPGIEHLLRYFSGVDKEFARYLENRQSLLAVFDQPIWFIIKNKYAELSKDEISDIGSTLEETGKQLQSHHDTYLAESGKKRYRDCVEVVKNLKKAHLYFIELQTIGDSEVGIREKTMFQNIVRIVEEGRPEEKIIVWVHNAHAAKSPVALLGTSNRDTEEMKLLGYMLAEKYGDRVVSIGMASPGDKNTKSDFQPQPDVLDHLLAETGLEFSFLNIAALESPENGKNLLDSSWKLTADQGGHLLLNPAASFEGIFFIKHVTGARHSSKSAERMKTLF